MGIILSIIGKFFKSIIGKKLSIICQGLNGYKIHDQCLLLCDHTLLVYNYVTMLSIKQNLHCVSNSIIYVYVMAKSIIIEHF